MANRIREIRKSKGMTLLQLAERLGVSESTVQRYESGNIKNLKYETMTELSIIFNCSPSYLMGWDDSIIANSDFKIEIKKRGEDSEKDSRLWEPICNENFSAKFKFSNREVETILKTRELNAEGKEMLNDYLNMILEKEKYRNKNKKISG